MYITHTLGALSLQLSTDWSPCISVSDFCAPAATIEFCAPTGIPVQLVTLFKLTFPGFSFEAVMHDGRVHVRRNGLYQRSEQIHGTDPLHVAIQWATDSIGCGIVPWSGIPSQMNGHMVKARTPHTLPPLELHRMLRVNNLLAGTAYKSADDFFATVLDSIHLTEEDIRRFGAERFAWGKHDDPAAPFDEPEISRLVASFLASHGAARNFDVSLESVAGNGNLDFWVTAPVIDAGMAKVAIEAKKADNAKLVDGFSVQLPTYMQRLRAQHGIFLVYWLKSPGYPYPKQDSYHELEIDVLHPLPRGPRVRSIGLDLSRAPTPSKA